MELKNNDLEVSPSRLPLSNYGDVNIEENILQDTYYIQ